MQRPKEVRAFRLDRSVLDLLRLSARRHGVNENAYVESVLERNLSVDSLLQAFDYISIGKETFTSILGMTNADGLEIIGAERGRKAFTLAKELFESNNIELNFPRYLVETLGTHARWFRAEGTNVKPERITLHHAYGMKWSRFLKAYLASAYETVSRDKLELISTTDFVAVRIP
jgi:hypothetical protein